ncbi:hypothetical protein [Streptomyces sp. NRRL S-1868]|uniref:WXG100-like domain-containing protein n=1 Tax=Streptomyces sp. NRRL S-1868 TaxID=1463892 RepID=UPI00069235C3|nr:hypothetical protein [Streptomyces sp. NRRL S-1868]
MSLLDETTEKAKWLLEKMGLKWPEGDPDKLRAAAKAWRAFAKEVGEVQSAANHSARSIIDVNSGEATDAFEAFWGQYVGKGEKGWLRDLAKSARHMAEALDDYAGEIDSARNQLWTEIGISATVIVGEWP